MPSLIDLRRRVRAVKSTQQITKAMKMVAASKLRRAQERVVAARPFAREARRVLSSIASRVDETAHPLLSRRPGVASGPTMLIVIAADRGLCGSFNTNEPSADLIFDRLLQQLVQAQVLRALVESNAAFFAAQMTAMDAATRNSSDMLDSLTLYMNKIRQAAITREIIEVVSGAQAL